MTRVARDKTAIPDRPIMMTAQSVRGYLAGRKTETRRVIDPQPVDHDFGPHRGIQPAFVKPQTLGGYEAVDIAVMVMDNFSYLKNPPFRRGGKLWVKEVFSIADHGRLVDPCINYKADGSQIPLTDQDYRWASADGKIECTGEDLMKVKDGWQNQMFMPRWVSRITLEILEVYVRRLHDMDDDDALAEGIQIDSSGHAIREDDDINWGGPVPAYAEIWESLNAKRGWSWTRNPWVYVVCTRMI